MEEAVRDLVDRYRHVAPDSVGIAVRYEGDDYDVVYARETVREQYTPEEFEEKVKRLVVEGLGDPPDQDSLRLFGSMNAVVRHFDDAVVLHFPVDEFSGAAVTFDETAAPSLDTLTTMGVEAMADVR